MSPSPGTIIARRCNSKCQLRASAQEPDKIPPVGLKWSNIFQAAGLSWPLPDDCLTLANLSAKPDAIYQLILAAVLRQQADVSAVTQQCDRSLLAQS
jgi:hypothetical protein